MALELHSWPRSSGTRIAWALEELGMPYTYVEVDAKKKENLGPKFIALNPHGKVPALVDGEQRFFESLAILLYLGDRYAAVRRCDLPYVVVRIGPWTCRTPEPDAAPAPCLIRTGGRADTETT